MLIMCIKCQLNAWTLYAPKSNLSWCMFPAPRNDLSSQDSNSRFYPEIQLSITCEPECRNRAHFQLGGQALVVFSQRKGTTIREKSIGKRSPLRNLISSGNYSMIWLVRQKNPEVILQLAPNRDSTYPNNMKCA